MSFLIVFEDSDNFNKINEFNEGVEFLLRLSSMPDEWIPLKFIYFRNGLNSSEIFIGDIILRGYEVKYIDADSIVETRRSVEHCTPHADGAWLNELGWSQ